MVDEQMNKGCLGLSLLGSILFPIFGYLDFYVHSEHLQELWTIRGLTSIVFILSTFTIWKRQRLRFPFGVALFLVITGAISITAMCMVLDGYASPYYAGVNLVILAAVVVLPVAANRMAMVVSSILLIYILGILAQSGFIIRNPKPLVNNLFFMIGTGIIGVSASFLKEKMRLESFDRFIQLKRSAEILNRDLQSEQENVEALVHEITQRKNELQKALRLAQDARSEAQSALNLREEFISLASHELNTPLTSLTLQTKVARHKMAENDELPKETFERLVSSYEYQLKRLIRIVNDMLDISRIDSNRLELERNVVDLASLVSEVIHRSLERTEPGQSEIRLNAQPVKGEWDSFRLEQVVVNLIHNALKYGEGKPIEVEVYKAEKTAYIKIQDHGIGISPEAQTKIFNRFERAVHSRDFTGLGLGLYISRQIIEGHGGRIKVESAPGKGALFCVELPIT